MTQAIKGTSSGQNRERRFKIRVESTFREKKTNFRKKVQPIVLVTS
jgi:hypothetical protein